jgi:uncharacterized membrane protein
VSVVSISLWIHIVSVVVAIGGSAFVLFVLRPALQSVGSQERERVMERVHARFRVIVWIAFALIAITGLAAAGSLRVLQPQVLFGTVYGQLLLVKIVLALVLFACALLITIPLPSLARFRSRTPQYLRMIVSIAVIIMFIATWLRGVGR